MQTDKISCPLPDMVVGAKVKARIESLKDEEAQALKAVEDSPPGIVGMAIRRANLETFLVAVERRKELETLLKP